MVNPILGPGSKCHLLSQEPVDLAVFVAGAVVEAARLELILMPLPAVVGDDVDPDRPVVVPREVLVLVVVERLLQHPVGVTGGGAGNVLGKYGPFSVRQRDWGAGENLFPWL